MTKSNKKIWIIAGVALAFVIAVFAFLYFYVMPKGEAGDKTIGLTVVFSETEQKEYTIKTGAAYLGEALTKEELIEGEDGPYGLKITVVAGKKADESAQEWWRITQDGEMVNTGVDTTPIADGDHFELTLSKW